MISWITKMLLKFMKPIAKIAIAAGLLDMILNGANEDDGTEEISEEQVSGE